MLEIPAFKILPVRQVSLKNLWFENVHWNKLVLVKQSTRKTVSKGN
jgi:hypothetical protein